MSLSAWLDEALATWAGKLREEKPVYEDNRQIQSRGLQ